MRQFLSNLIHDFRTTNKARPSRRAKPARTRLSVEALEGRVTPTVLIQGTAGNDTITMNVTSSGDVSVSVNGHVSTYAYSPGASFEIDPLGGSNTVNILQLPEQGSEPVDSVNVNCQGGTDNITVGNDTPGGVYLVKGAVTVHGDGMTNVSVDDSHYTTPGFAYSIDAESVSWGGVNGSGLFYSNLANVTLDGGTAKSFGISGTAAGTVYRVNTGVGQNDISIGDGDLGALQGSVAVFGNGTNTLELYDSASDTAASYNITQNFISRRGFAGLTYGDIHTLTLYGTGEGATYAVPSTAFNTSYVVNAGGLGSNPVNFGDGNLDDLAGPVEVNSAGGNVSVFLDDQGNAFPETYTLGATSVGPTDFFGGLTYSGITSLTVDGGSGGNAFAVTATPNVPVQLNGGSGHNTLTGPNASTDWRILGPNNGTLGANVSFQSMGNLVGGSGNDTFSLAQRVLFVHTVGSISGTINGGGGTNTLDFAAAPGPVAVNLGTSAASLIRGGAAGGFANINRVVGSVSAADTLTGPNAATDWNISTPNGGTAGGVAFAGFENLVGGSGADTFHFHAGGSLKGMLDGGLAPVRQGNWLDYSGLTSAVTVNLKAGAATGVAGGAAGKVARIQNVHGGDGGNTLNGNSQGNILIGGAGHDVLTGGTGRSILIGDAGADTVTGGSGNDILIGDGTTFDTMSAANRGSLMAILAEWQSADDYATRFADINTGAGGGLNGAAKLNFGTTVLDDGSADTVTGLATGQPGNWFFQGTGDVLHNRDAGEHVNNA